QGSFWQAGTLRLWDVVTGKELRPFGGHSRGVGHVAFAPDGKTLASGSWDRTGRLWQPTTGQELRLLKGHEDWITAVAFAPDGKTLATADRESLRLWQATGKLLRQIPGTQGDLTALAFSSDGKTLLTGGLHGRPQFASKAATVQTWEVATGKELR